MPNPVVQTSFTATLPTERVGDPAGATTLAPGDIVSFGFDISTVVAGVVGPPVLFTFPVPPTDVPGSAVVCPFAMFAPSPFVPVAGTEYSAFAYDTDKNGVSSGNTGTLTWTQAFAAPLPPTGFSVA